MLFLRPLYTALFALTATTVHAGPNAGVEIELTRLSPACGLGAGQRIEFLVHARQMEGVRQIKFDFHWTPSGAVTSAVGGTGAATESKSFIAPGPPQIEGDTAGYGMAVFGGNGLSGDGELALLGFEIAPDIPPDTPLALYLDLVSLGPSSTERDTVYPIGAMALANYCDAAGQPLDGGVFIESSASTRLYSSAEQAVLSDASQGEIDLVARLLEGPVFGAGRDVTWQVDNPGPGTLYALADDRTLSIDPGEIAEVQGVSDRQGSAQLRLDASGQTGETAARVRACAAPPEPLLCDEQLLVWRAPITAVTETAGPAQPGESHLQLNYPNPFNAGTELAFDIGTDDANAPVSVVIYSTLGQRVATLFDAVPAAGRHRAYWDGRHEGGQAAASGIYFARFTSTSVTQVRRMLLLR